MKSLFPLIILLALLVPACAPLSPPAAGPAPVDLPPRFSLYDAEPEPGSAWWLDFNSPELTRLIEQGIDNNFSISEAEARLAQARLVAKQTEAALLPEVTAQGGASHVDQKLSSSSRLATDEWSLGLAASYEVDLWGRIRAQRQSALAVADASSEDLKTAVMTITGQIGETWISLVESRQQQDLLNRQLVLQNQLLQLIRNRFSLAQSTALDIYQQQQAVEQIKTTLITRAAAEATLLRQLALLTGRASLAPATVSQRDYPDLPELPAIGLPADILALRPDVRGGGLRLRSTQWEISAARADRLPALMLTASHTFTGGTMELFFDTWLLRLAGSLTGPIFDNGRRKLEVERIRAVADERLATYGRLVFTAFKEVEDAMAAEKEQTKTLVSLHSRRDLAVKTMQEARRRYLNGSNSFLNVLREELNTLQLERDIIVAEQQRLLARIQLHRALGGSWVNGYVGLSGKDAAMSHRQP